MKLLSYYICFVYSIYTIHCYSSYFCTNSSTSAVCAGNDLLAAIRAMPASIQNFTYMAYEKSIRLNQADFSNLTNLRELVITTDDDRTYNDRQIENITNENLFAPLVALEVLRINVVWRMSYPLPSIFKPLINLRVLDLSGTVRINLSNLAVSFTGLRDKRNITHINLWNVNAYSHSNQNMFNLSLFLEPLSKSPLKHLNIGYNSLKAIYPGLITYAPQLQTLDASSNMLNPFLTSAFFTEIILHAGLVEVDVSQQGHRGTTRHGSMQVKKRSIWQRNKFKANDQVGIHPIVVDIFQQLKGNNMYSNHINSSISEIGLISQCLDALKSNFCSIFDQECAVLKRIFLLNHNIFCSAYKTYLNSFLDFFDAIPCSAIPRFESLISRDCASCIVIPTVGNTRILHLQKLNMYDDAFVPDAFWENTLCFNQQTHLQYLDLSDNYGYGYKDIDVFLQSTVSGLKSVKVLNLSNTGLLILQPYLCDSYPNLEVVDLSRNRLIFKQNSQAFLGKCSSSLKEIILSFNSIEKISLKLFSHLKGLRILDLSHNLITEFSTDLSIFTNLERIDLSYNSLTSLPPESFINLASLFSVKRKTAHINLEQNRLLCSCQTLTFIKVIRDYQDKYIDFDNFNHLLCLDADSNYKRIKNINITFEEIQCALKGTFFILLGFIIAIPVLLLGIYFYRKRWWFRYHWFVAHRLWQGYRRIATLDESYTYDAFVSYNQHDEEWIEEYLQPILEAEKKLKLCLHHRDFRPGEAITNSIIESIETSRKSLFILSPSFLKSTWCHFEIQMAQNRLFNSGKDVILLAILKPLPDKSISKTLKSLLESRVYVEWTEDEYGQKLFWAKLEEAIKAQTLEPFDLEYSVDQPKLSNNNKSVAKSDDENDTSTADGGQENPSTYGSMGRDWCLINNVCSDESNYGATGSNI